MRFPTTGEPMNERVPAAVAVVSSIIIVAYACSTTPATTSPTPQPIAGQQVAGGPPRGPGGQRLPLTDSARRVRDSVNAARRDSGAAMVLRSIAGRETQPAESVFKNIKILKGIPAGRLVAIMNMGFGRSLGVSCGFCHVPGKWDLDEIAATIERLGVGSGPTRPASRSEKVFEASTESRAEM